MFFRVKTSLVFLLHRGYTLVLMFIILVPVVCLWFTGCLLVMLMLPWFLAVGVVTLCMDDLALMVAGPAGLLLDSPFFVVLNGVCVTFCRRACL